MADITISAFDTEYIPSKTPAYVCLFPNRSFHDSNGDLVVGGQDPTKMRNYYRRLAVSQAGNIIHVPAFSGVNTVASTVDNATGQSAAEYILPLFTSSGSFIAFLYTGIKIPSDPTTTTWEALSLFSDAHRQPQQHEYYDTVQTQRLLALLSGGLWGGILGTLGNQSDLQAALDAKVSNTGNETIAGVKTFSSSPYVPAPVADLHAATKKYADDVANAAVAGLSWKQKVRAATTVNGTLATAFENGDTIDGVVLVTGDRILIKDQSSAIENGVYVVAASGAPTRATDTDSGTELISAAVFVGEGTVNARTQWVCTTVPPITIGVSSITFVQFSSGGVSWGDITGTLSDQTDVQQSVAYTAAVPFSAGFTKIANHTMSADVTFTVDSTDQIIGAVTSVRLTSDGTHDIAFTGIKIVAGSQVFDTSNGILNVLLFWFDGTEYWVNIIQEADTTAPVLSTATVEDADSDKIVLTYGEALDTGSVPAVTDFAPSGGRTVTNVAIVGAVVTLTVDTPYIYGDTITISYTAGSNPIQDEDGNNAVNLVAHAVTNNVAAAVVDIEPDLSVSGTTFDHVGESPAGTWKAIDIVADWNHWAQCLQKLPASTDGYIEIEPAVGICAIGFMDTDDAGNYTTIDWGAFGPIGGTIWALPAEDTGFGYAAGDKFRIKRTSGTITMVRVRGGVEQVCKTFGGTHNSELFIKFVLFQLNDTFILPKGFATVDK